VQPAVTELSAEPQHPSGAVWEGGPTLLGYDLAPSPEGIELALYWRAGPRPEAQLARFVHAVGSRGEMVAQADGAPENGGIPFTAWRPGEIVTDRVRLAGNAGETGMSYRVGWYDPRTGVRAPVRDAGGVRLPDGYVTLRP